MLLLLLTGVRTGELRYATQDQFDLNRGLWLIPVVRLKPRKQLTKKKRQRFSDIPPYIVPLSLQAQEIVRHLLEISSRRRSISSPVIGTSRAASARTRSTARSRACRFISIPIRYGTAVFSLPNGDAEQQMPLLRPLKPLVYQAIPNRFPD